MRPQQAILSDINDQLINAYVQIKMNVGHIIEGLARHQSLHSKEHYYQTRDAIPKDELEAAINFIYLRA